MSTKTTRRASSSRTELPAMITAAEPPAPERRAAATTVVLAEDHAGSVAAIAAALPDPSALPPGQLVVVPGEVAPHARSLARSLLSAFVRPRTVSRAYRCTALVARGYVDVGSAGDERGGELAWGYAPGARPAATDAT